MSVHSGRPWLPADAARGARAAVVGILCSTLLAAVKILAGIFGNSYALIADGFESMADVVSSLVVWGSVRVAATEPNERFPYGYGKVEPLGALFVATALLVAAVAIAAQSVREILTPHHTPAPFTLVVLVLVVATKEALFRYVSRAGAATGSRAVQAEAWHHRADSLTSLAAFVGISVALLAGPGWAAADDWAALFASGVVAWNGTRLLRVALAEVLDAAPPPETVERVRALAAAVPGVVEIDKCRLRKSGSGLYVDIHVVVDGGIPVRHGHAIAHRVKDALLAADQKVLDASVHVEPSGPRV